MIFIQTLINNLATHKTKCTMQTNGVRSNSIRQLNCQWAEATSINVISLNKELFGKYVEF